MLSWKPLISNNLLFQFICSLRTQLSSFFRFVSYSIPFPWCFTTYSIDFHVIIKINPVTIIINQITDNTNLKISFNILILQMDFVIVAVGRFSLPAFYWMLSIIILITAMSVPISNTSWISAVTTFFSSFNFFSICISSFPLLMILLYIYLPQ